MIDHTFNYRHQSALSGMNNTCLRIDNEGNILEQKPNAKDWPVECRAIGLMIEKLQRQIPNPQRADSAAGEA